MIVIFDVEIPLEKMACWQTEYVTYLINFYQFFVLSVLIPYMTSFTKLN